MDSEEELAYFYYESHQYSPKQNEEVLVSTKKAAEKEPIFDHSSDEESDDDIEKNRKLENYQRELSPESSKFYFADKLEKLKERRAAKEKKEIKCENVAQEGKHEVMSEESLAELEEAASEVYYYQSE
ncbi:hypothetical protein Hanom_Chr16g01451231 [Helianthus anomalus]